MSTPVLTFGEFVVLFDAESECESARDHFIDFCGWTEQQFSKIKDYPFFCAKVSIWKDGQELATDYLGSCSYKTTSAFYTRYRSDYFADMVARCVAEINNPELTAAHAPWADLMQKENARHQLSAKKAWEKREAKKAARAAA